MNNFDLSQAVGAALELPYKIKIESYIGGELFRVDSFPTQTAVDANLKVLNRTYKNASTKFICNVYPDCSTDINAGWVLVKPMAKAGYNFKLISYFGLSYRAIFSPIGSGSGGSFNAEHAPTAILRAAAMALGVLE